MQTVEWNRVRLLLSDEACVRFKLGSNIPKRWNTEGEAAIVSSFCGLGCLAASTRDELACSVPHWLLLLPGLQKNNIKLFLQWWGLLKKKTWGNTISYWNWTPTSFTIGLNHLLEYYYWKSNGLVITFSNLSADNLSLFCSQYQNILASVYHFIGGPIWRCEDFSHKMLRQSTQIFFGSTPKHGVISKPSIKMFHNLIIRSCYLSGHVSKQHMSH